MIFQRFLYIFSCLALFACSTRTEPSAIQEEKPVILVSIAPYQFFAQKICGNAITVHSIVPQGANAHIFEPTPKQREKIKKAEVWFRIGEPFETPLIKLFSEKSHIIDLRDGIELLDMTEPTTCCKGEKDRHLWMSPRAAKQQSLYIASTLSKTFPEHKELFATNLEKLLLDLDHLEKEIRTTLAPLQQRSLLVSHPAFGYFCRDFSLKQLSVEFEGKEPRPKQVEILLSSLEENRPLMAIAMPQHDNRGAQTIAKKILLPIQWIDPYSNDYFSMMRDLTQKLSKAASSGES